MSRKCADCGGDGMYLSKGGMTVCSCDAGRSRREYLEMSEAERREAFRDRTRSRKKKSDEVIPF